MQKVENLNDCILHTKHLLRDDTGYGFCINKIYILIRKLVT